MMKESKKRLWLLFAVGGLLFNAVQSPAQSPDFWNWASRPVMGWNSWDFYGTTVTETQTMSQANYMAANLLSHGWNLITVDIQWYAPDPAGAALANGRDTYQEYWTPNSDLVMDGYGRLQPATTRFPSAAGGVGFTNLAYYVHSKDLKFGIHIMRGIPRQAVYDNLPVYGTTNTVHAQDIADTSSTCPWNPDMFGVDMTKPGAQAYYDSIVSMYDQWGVDFIKCDDLSRPYHEPEIEALRKAIDKVYAATGHTIVLSTSPGATPVNAGENVMQNANQWRIADDFWDNWSALTNMFSLLHNWEPYQGPGHFPDADMLPLGKVDAYPSNPTGRSTYFTQDEQFSLMSMWAIARSPLILGADLTQMDSFTLSLLTNDEVIAVNQYSLHNRQLFNTNNLIAWTADSEGSTDKYLAVINANSRTTNVPVNLASLGFTNSCTIRSLWFGTNLPGSYSGTFSPAVPKHGAALYRLSGQSIPVPWITSAVAGNQQVTLSWEPIASANSFSVKRSTSETGTYTTIMTGVTGSSYTDNTAQNGTTYYYKVTASIGGQTSPDSAVRSATPAGAPGIVSWNYDWNGTVGDPAGGTTNNMAGIILASNWNNSWYANPTVNLMDINGQPSTVSIVYNSAGATSIQNSHPGVDANGNYNKELLNGYLSSGAGQIPATSSVNITGIPFAYYDLYVYFSSGTAGYFGTVTDGTATYSFKTIGSSSISGLNATLTQTTDAGTGYPSANYALFSGVYGSNKVIHCDIPLGGGIAGFQIVPGVPSAPGGFKASAAGWQVMLSWPTYGPATNYVIKRATAIGGPYTVIAVTDGTSYLDSDVTIGGTYYYTLSAQLPSLQTPDTSPVSVTVGTSLQADLTFDDGSGATATDVTGHGWNGTLMNGPAWVIGYSNDAVSLDGTDQYILLPSGVVTNLNDFSITAWVNVNSLANWARVFDFGTGTSAYMFLAPQSGDSGNPGNLRFAITVSGNTAEQQINAPSPLPPGGWHQVAVTLNHGVGVLYVDGNPVGTNSAIKLTPANLGNTTQNYLGKSQWPDPYLSGAVDEFHIYKGALTPGEAATFITPLVPPAGLNGAAGDASVSLAWNASANASGYNILSSTNLAGPYTLQAACLTGLAFADTHVQNGVLYYYVVSATNTIGGSANSAPIGVRPVSMTTPQLGCSRNGNQLQLNWPADHTGWRLQAQTNSLATGLATNWFDVPGAAATNSVNLPTDSVSGSVFYRLVYP